MRRKQTKQACRVGRPRVAIYTRVSTDRQSAHEISEVDQLKQLRRACVEREWDIAAEFNDASSAFLGQHRPEFERMLAQAVGPDHPFDIIFVHSLSRYYRDMLMSEQRFRELERHGVQVTSLTENIDGEAGWMMRSLIAMFNEQSSRETSKHVKRTRIENAKQGYWNGGKPPIGYMSVPCEELFGDKTKKRLAEDPEWAPIIRLIFRLHREGDGEGHPLGAVGICDYLNRHGYKSRSNGLWHASTVHRILTNEAYVGRVYMNRIDTSTGVERPRSEWVYSPAPALVSDEEFEETQIRLIERCPDRQPPRTTTSDVMLGGIVHCRSCGSAMTAGTGTSRTGKVYSYYVCSGRANKGATACTEPQRVRREDLDDRVLSAVAIEVLTPERVHVLTNAVAERRRDYGGDLAKELEGAKASLASVERKLDRLVAKVLEGVLTESDAIRRNQNSLETEKERLTSIIRLKSSKLKQGLTPISLGQAEKLAETLRQNLMESPPQIRRRYIQSIVSRVDVGSHEIVIQGPYDAIAEASHPEAGGRPPVQSSVREWRTERDSNPRYAFTYTRFPSVRDRPLRHLSVHATSCAPPEVDPAGGGPDRTRRPPRQAPPTSPYRRRSHYSPEEPHAVPEERRTADRRHRPARPVRAAAHRRGPLRQRPPAEGPAPGRVRNRYLRHGLFLGRGAHLLEPAGRLGDLGRLFGRHHAQPDL